VNESDQGVVGSVNEDINQLAHNLNPQVRSRSKNEASQLQLTPTQAKIWPVLDLNRSQGSKSWSMGRTSTSGSTSRKTCPLRSTPVRRLFHTTRW
jgi:hypothetical protein